MLPNHSKLGAVWQMSIRGTQPHLWHCDRSRKRGRRGEWSRLNSHVCPEGTGWRYGSADVAANCPGKGRSHSLLLATGSHPPLALLLHSPNHAVRWCREFCHQKMNHSSQRGWLFGRLTPGVGLTQILQVAVQPHGKQQPPAGNLDNLTSRVTES